MKTKLCKKSGCGRTAAPGKDYCIRHIQLQDVKKQVFTYRAKSNKYHDLYNSARWRKISKEFLTKYNICLFCGKPAKIADHIKPHRGDLTLFYDENNLQPLCWSCHSRKTFVENNNFNKKGDRGVKT